MKSLKKPTHDQIDKAVALLAHAEQYRYFFDKLENPLWIAPLVEKGYFKTPPRIVEDKEKGLVRFPPWPESKYLVRMSENIVSHKEISEIINTIDTDNTSVIGDFLDCLIKMPADLSVQSSSHVKSWMTHVGMFWLLPEKYSKYIAHLAENGHTKEAIQLTRVLLAVQPDPRRVAQSSSKDDDYRLPPDAVPKFHDHEYEEVLKEIIPPLAKNAGLEAVEVYSDILQVAIKMSLFKPEESQPEDYSYVWHPAIEDHEQNHDSNVKEHLVRALRETLKVISESNTDNKKKALEVLSKRNWIIFHRLKLYIINEYPDDIKDLIEEEIINRDNFTDSSLNHEYFDLIKKHFPRLNKANKNIVLGWIVEGPDVNNYKNYIKELSGNEATDEQVQKYVRHWKFIKYYPIANSLHGSCKEEYDGYLKEFGEPDHPSFTSHSSSGTWHGPTSPKKPEEISKLSAKELVSLFKDWTPSRDIETPSREGLGRELTALIANDPSHFEGIIPELRGVHPTYVRSVISGYRDASKNNKVIPWDQLFDLCKWVLEQPYDASEQEKSWGEDSGWGWTRNSIAELLTTGFETGTYQIPFSYRERAWKIVMELTEDPDPSEEREANRKNKNNDIDPATLSINSNRGEAMHAVVKYSLWVRRELEKTKKKEELDKEGFDNLPEVRTVLEKHLDTKIDPSLGIRAVYGQWLPWLILLDSKWVKSKLDQIFPKSEEERPFFDAAWDTYISFCNPYKDVIDLVPELYELAINKISTTDEKQSQKNIRLAQHLCVFYWIGEIDLSNESLFTKFFKRAPISLKAQVIDFIGRSLRDTKEDVPIKVVERLQVLWNSRLAAVESNKEPSEQLEGFGWWFVSEKLDRQWSIDQLLNTLRLTKKIDPDHSIMDHLENFANDFPVQVAECIALMVEGEKEGWGLLDWGKNLRGILVKILSTKNEIAEKTVNNLINELGKKGLMDYRDLAK